MGKPKKEPIKSALAAEPKAKPAPRAAKTGNEMLMEKLTTYIRTNADTFLADPNVTSVGIGYKSTAGVPSKQLAIQFTVASKVRPEALAPLGTKPIPPSINLDGTVIPTDVLERTFKPSFTVVNVKPKDAHRARADTLQPGISIGGIRTEGGTLGTMVLDLKSNSPVLLSNWHVLEGPQGAPGNDVVQPATFDDNQTQNNVVGKLIRSHLGPAGDCAIASIVARPYTNNQLDLGNSVSEIGAPDIGDHVVKSGRTSAVTYGVVARLEVNTRMQYGGGVQCTVGGFEVGPDPSRPSHDTEISRPGDSGSVWFAVDKKGKPTDVMLGLHFAGDADDTEAEFALACYARSVMSKLEIAPLPRARAQGLSQEEAEQYRTGFDRNFLTFPVDLAGFTSAVSKDLARLEGRREIPYCHFSVWLSKRRRYPACVAWNIDGDNYKRLKRTGFRTDRRGDLEQHQLTNEIYKDNDLDKGHIARRADLCWGSPEEAQQGNYDSFFYTNISPQHAAFNQSENTDGEPDGGLWGRLENTVFDSENPHGLRVSLFGGPIIGKKDIRFEQNNEACYLPREFWKVVCYRDTDDNKDKVFAFILSQAKLLVGLAAPEGLNFDEWLWARITLKELQDRTGIEFAKSVHDREVAFTVPQALGKTISVKPLYSKEEYYAD